MQACTSSSLRLVVPAARFSTPAVTRHIAAHQTKAQLWAREVLGVKNPDAYGKPLPEPTPLPALKYDHSVSTIPALQAQYAAADAATARTVELVTQNAKSLSVLASPSEADPEDVTPFDTTHLDSYETAPGDCFAVVDLNGKQFKLMKSDTFMTGRSFPLWMRVSSLIFKTSQTAWMPRSALRL